MSDSGEDEVAPMPPPMGDEVLVAPRPADVDADADAAADQGNLRLDSAEASATITGSLPPVPPPPVPAAVPPPPTPMGMPEAPAIASAPDSMCSDDVRDGRRSSTSSSSGSSPSTTSGSDDDGSGDVSRNESNGIGGRRGATVLSGLRDPEAHETVVAVPSAAAAAAGSSSVPAAAAAATPATVETPSDDSATAAVVAAPHPIRSEPLPLRAKALIERLIKSRRLRVDPALSEDWLEAIATSAEGIREVLLATADADGGGGGADEPAMKANRAEGGATSAADATKGDRDTLVLQSKRVLRWRASPQGISMAIRFSESTMCSIVCTAAVVRCATKDAAAAPLLRALKEAAAHMGEAESVADVKVPDDDADHGAEWVSETLLQTWDDLGDRSDAAAAEGDAEAAAASANEAPADWRRDVLEVLLVAYGHDATPARRLANILAARKEAEAMKAATWVSDHPGLEPIAAEIRRAQPSRSVPFVDDLCARRYGISTANMLLVLERCRNDQERAGVGVNLCRANLGVTTVDSILHVTGIDQDIIRAVINAATCALPSVVPRQSAKPSELSSEIPSSWDICARTIGFLCTAGATKTSGALRLPVISTIDGIPVYVGQPRFATEAPAAVYSTMLKNPMSCRAMMPDGVDFIAAGPELDNCERVLNGKANPTTDEQRTQARLAGVLMSASQRTLEGLGTLPLLKCPRVAKTFTAQEHFMLFRVAVFAAAVIKDRAQGRRAPAEQQQNNAAGAGAGAGGGSGGGGAGGGGGHTRSRRNRGGNGGHTNNTGHGGHGGGGGGGGKNNRKKRGRR